MRRIVRAWDLRERSAVSVNRSPHPVAGMRTTYLTSSSNWMIWTRLYDPLSRETRRSSEERFLPEIRYRTFEARVTRDSALIDKSGPKRFCSCCSSEESGEFMLK